MKLSLKMNVTATSIEAADVGRYSAKLFKDIMERTTHEEC